MEISAGVQRVEPVRHHEGAGRWLVAWCRHTREPGADPTPGPPWPTTQISAADYLPSVLECRRSAVSRGARAGRDCPDDHRLRHRVGTAAPRVVLAAGRPRRRAGA